MSAQVSFAHLKEWTECYAKHAKGIEIWLINTQFIFPKFYIPFVQFSVCAH